MTEQTKKIITRFPPSPTGYLHVGSARTALFNYIYAKQNGGEMLFRSEDTDRERSKKEFEDEILESLEWLGIEIDKTKIVRQSERGETYRKYLEKMIADGTAYVSKEIAEKEGDRTEVIRFKNPNKKVIFKDTVRGDIEFDTTELGDFVIAKSLTEPLYHLAVVVDDYEMGVTHIIRGEDGISNTPRQILIQEAINAPRPFYTHMPFSLAPDRSKLSKRHGAVSIREYRKMGYLPEAMINYLMLLGWNPGTDKEIFSLGELIEEFDLTKIQKGGAIFDLVKLDWFNKEYIKKMSEQSFREKVLEFLPEKLKDMREYSDEILTKMLPVIKERINKFSDLKEMFEGGELEYYFKNPEYNGENLLWKDAQKQETIGHLNKIISIIDNIDNFQSDEIKTSLWDYATEKGRGNVLWPMRFALSGKDKSPDPFTLSEILGKQKTIERLKIALDKLK
ncbi:TPA: glutamate--tRNA ligase [Candidatus Campbellbacteria bacterium]|nr:MAG: glutamyl-tRNA synthetase, glutamyl-tRNA synthetase [Candidatus Campbellbacteria bacterium GW2011_OD1_34_28]KKP74936.1 MAG: Glutamate-tRNA ligase [Candidatus Campbellbacteria bacterium GW2011_GWD2_35_24]KKP75822.1 MAG: glutamyl-tRNA synthetase, glutamyl-tRNA synthetase [Candidatus Campbellbacteria bacterium GW2011_GWC2_35_28]KKP76930.1 MAG: Glutamate-tRNA ligase [Candidatus Campbellbacteria bacterium GW2011_GWC1_35_31]KKP78856.1 MAG: Glutamate-tRNA ligase [Candidatus Campbellbacteria bac